MDDNTWVNPFLMESKVADIISEQARNGCTFNKRQATWHVHTLQESIINIDKELVPLLPLMFNKGTSYKKPFKINGQFMKYPQIYCEAAGLTREEIGGPFTAVWYSPFDPSKTALIKNVMLDFGWKPAEWNAKKMPFQTFMIKRELQRTTYAEWIERQPPDRREEYEIYVNAFIEKHFKKRTKPYMKEILSQLNFTTGVPTFGDIKKKLMMSSYWPSSPKINAEEDEWVTEGDDKIATLLSLRMQTSHRRSLLQGLIAQVRPDGKLEGQANPCATPTARMRHRIIVNIPAARAFFGKQCRSLFTGDINESSTKKPVLFKEPLKDDERIKPFTNIKQQFDPKTEKWKDKGSYLRILHSNADAFVGGDGAGLELRMLTHYLIDVSLRLLALSKKKGDEKGIAKYQSALDSAYIYRDTLLDGDIHSHNQHLAGLPTRDAAKSFIYAFLYGAGDAKLGSLVNGNAADGKRLRARFLAECPCIPVLIEWCQQTAGQLGWLPAIDGRRLIMRRDEQSGEVMTHKALNTLLQAAGSIVMKYSMLFLYNWNKRDKIPAKQVIMMHDEFQFTCPWEFVPGLQKNVDACVRKAGEYLDMKCPLASDSIVGRNWYDTH